MKPSFSGDAARELALIADGIERMVTDSLSLAKLEIAQRARVVGRGLGRVGVFAMVAGLGYALLTVALALWISSALGPSLAFLIVGGAHAAVGGVGLKIAVDRLRASP